MFKIPILIAVLSIILFLLIGKLLFNSFVFFLGIVLIIARGIFSIFGIVFICFLFGILILLISKFVKEKEVKLSKEDINEYVNTCMNYINNIKNYIKEKLIMLNKVTTNGNGLCDYEENVKRYYSLIDNSVKSEFGYDYIVYTQNTCEYNQVNWNYNIFSIKYNLSKYKKSYKKVDSIFITFHKHNTLTMKEVLRLVEEFLPKDCAQIDSIIENNSSKIKYTILYKSNLIKKNKSIIKVVLLKIKEPLVHSKEDIVEYKEQFVSAKIF